LGLHKELTLLIAAAAGRVGDTYGALQAGAHLLLSTTLVDDKAPLGWLDQIGWHTAATHGCKNSAL
jgi:hypothetical protein